MVDSNKGDPVEKAEKGPATVDAVSKPEATSTVTPSASSMAQAEAARTQPSDGSLRDRQALIASQEDSIEISFPGGRASRTTKLTEKDLTDLRPIFEKSVEQTGPKSFALGVDYDQRRSPADKLCDFVSAATARATNPANYQAYIQSDIDKMAGVGEGLNMAKEESKASMRAAWTALTDGTVANFLAKPNAINDPLFHTIAATFEAMAKDANATNAAMERFGQHLLQSSDEYSKLSDREKGHVIGKTAFGLVNPEGSTEGAEAAMKIAETVSTHLDAQVSKAVGKAYSSVQELAKTAPAVAEQTKQMLLDYVSRIGLTPNDMQLAGIPAGYFDGMTAGGTASRSENLLAMAKARDSGAGGAGEIGRSGESSAPRELSAYERQQLHLQAEKHAVNLLKKAVDVEPALSSDMQALSKIHKGNLVDFEHRVKTRESLTRKIEQGNKPQSIKDTLRYTMLFHDEDLVAGVRGVIRSLEDDGCEALKVKNTFKERQPYKGINCSFDRDGQIFELQFHTPDSYAMKHQNHPLYEFSRELFDKDPITGENIYHSRQSALETLAKHRPQLAPYPHLEDVAEHFVNQTRPDLNTEGVFRTVDEHLILTNEKVINPYEINSLEDVDKFGGTQ